MNGDRSKLLVAAMGSGSVAIIVLGVVVALLGSSFGWLLVAVGVLDLAAIPFMVRLIGGRRATRTVDSATDPPGEVEMPSAPPDPTFNPYARED